jgi:hypothetical protein
MRGERAGAVGDSDAHYVVDVESRQPFSYAARRRLELAPDQAHRRPAPHHVEILAGADGEILLGDLGRLATVGRRRRGRRNTDGAAEGLDDETAEAPEDAAEKAEYANGGGQDGGKKSQHEMSPGIDRGEIIAARPARRKLVCFCTQHHHMEIRAGKSKCRKQRSRGLRGAAPQRRARPARR